VAEIEAEWISTRALNTTSSNVARTPTRNREFEVTEGEFIRCRTQAAVDSPCGKIATPMTRAEESRRLVASALLVAASAWILDGCAGPPEAPLPNIILISVDTLRADRLGSYGFTAATSPTLDRLAGLGVRFENAISPSSWTLPAHMSLITSQLVSTHGVVDDETALSDSAATLAEALSSQGYKTTGFVSWVYLSPKFGFGQGFDRYTFVPGNARAVVDAVEEWHSTSAREPYFLFVHFFDPHMDFTPPPPYDRLFVDEYTGPVDGSYLQIKPQILGLHESIAPIDPADRQHLDALYQGEIRFVDDEIARLLAAVDTRSPLADSLVVVVSDHGEELGDHGSLEGHGWTLYEEILHVPMIWNFPDSAYQGTVVREPVGLIDVAPTILDFLDIESPDQFQGRSLLPLLKPREEMAASPPVVADSGGRFGIFKRAVRGPRFKLIETRDTGDSEIGLPIDAGYELYDLESDPGEQQDLYHPDHPEAQRLLRILELADRPHGDGEMEATTPAQELSEEEKKMLESLGYIQ
jgi:arylsulfatase A-like enzyme